MRILGIVFATLLLVGHASAAENRTDLTRLRDLMLSHAQALARHEDDSAKFIGGLRALAKKRVREAQFLLGMFMLAGKVPVHEGTRWLVDADSEGCAGAAGLLGGMYMTDQVGPKNVVAGIMWLRRGARRGDPGAQILLATALARGVPGQPAEPILAYSWALQAAQNPALDPGDPIRFEVPQLAQSLGLTRTQFAQATHLMKERMTTLGENKPYFCGSSLPDQGLGRR